MKRFINHYSKGKNVFGVYALIYAYFITVFASYSYFTAALLKSDKPVFSIVIEFIGCLNFYYAVGIIIYLVLKGLMILLYESLKSTTMKVMTLGLLTLVLMSAVIFGLNTSSIVKPRTITTIIMVISIMVAIYFIIITAIYILNITFAYKRMCKGTFVCNNNFDNAPAIGQPCRIEVLDLNFQIKPEKVTLTPTSIMIKDSVFKVSIGDNNKATVYTREKGKWKMLRESHVWTLEFYPEMTDYLYGEIDN